MDNNKKTYIIINKLSSCANKIDIDYIKNNFDGQVIYFDGNNILPKDADKIICLGGDGTLNHLINDYPNIEKYYIPCGTFNESAKNALKQNDGIITKVGQINDKYFAYVLATGAFTPLGYSTSNKVKHTFKIFAYLLNVIREYKIYKIPATVKVDSKTFYDAYSLIMVSNASRCFGFNFNRLYNPTKNILQLLLIRAPKHNGLLGKIEMFIPFFRCFFIGFSKEKISKNITFVNTQSIDIKINENTPFCVDGDKWVLGDNLHIKSTALKPPVKIFYPKKRGKYKKSL